MFEQVIKIFIKLGLLTGGLASLALLGAGIDSLVNWDYLTYFFVVFRHLLSVMDFLVDTDTLLTLIGYGFIIQLAWWTYTLSLRIYSYFNPDSK